MQLQHSTVSVNAVTVDCNCTLDAHFCLSHENIASFHLDCYKQLQQNYTECLLGAKWRTYPFFKWGM